MGIQLVENKLLIERKKWQQFSENFYVVALVIYIISQFLPGTMFPGLLPSALPYRITQLSGILVILKIIFFDIELRNDKWKNWLIFIFVGCVLWKACSDAFQYNLYYYYLFVVGARNIDYKKTLKVFLVTLVSLVAFTVFSAEIRLIPGLTMGRFGTPTVRYALGMVYPSDLAARAFYLMLAYCVFRRFRLALPEYIGCIAWTILIYVITDTKLDLLMMGIVIISAVFYPFLKKVIDFVGAKLLVLGSLALICLSILMAYFYVPSNPIFSFINRFLSDRLKYENAAFEKYNVPVFGQYIHQRGNGGFQNKGADYFFIDSSYIRHLMMNGFIAFMVVIGIICFLLAKYTRQHAYSLVLYLLFMIVSSIIDQHMLEISYNFIFISFLTNTDYFIENWKSLSHMQSFRQE